MKKNTFILIGLIAVIILAVGVISYFKASPITGLTITDDEAKAIAANSTLIYSKTCSHCIEQEQILGKYIIYFNLVDVAEHPEILKQYQVKGVPAWIINGKKYEGVKSLKELKDLTSVQ